MEGMRGLLRGGLGRSLEALEAVGLVGGARAGGRRAGEGRGWRGDWTWFRGYMANRMGWGRAGVRGWGRGGGVWGLWPLRMGERWGGMGCGLRWTAGR